MKTTPQVTENHRRRSDIDLGLAVVAAVTPSGTRWTQTDLAAVCGCTLQAIQHIEYRALAKLREHWMRDVEPN